MRVHTSPQLTSPSPFAFQVIAKLQRLAPGVVIVTRPLTGALPSKSRGRLIDMAVAGFFGDLPEGFHQKSFAERICLCCPPWASKDKGQNQHRANTLVKDTFWFRPRGILKASWIRCCQPWPKSARCCRISSFQSPCFIVSQSDLIVTLPRDG